ncbi:MAG: hypothetical protein PHG25_00555 [Candidatus Pacebacteria bacterium]|nr:hypothetical protein [Candidatus Paceibacterota bacterium]
MPRRVQDIIPANRRSIRDIPASQSSEKEAVSRATQKTERKEKKSDQERPIAIHREHIPVEEPVEQAPPVKKARKQKKFPWALSIIGIVVLFAGVGFFISSHFASATFTLVPKVLPVSVSGTYIVPSAVPGSFGYETMNLSGTASTTVLATQGSYTETKAQGKITVYNAYSAQSQRLVAGTRLAGNSGLVYRLTSSIVIPGYTKLGTSNIPGSIVTSMIAEKAGEDYNISRADSISDLKVIAYKGTAKYAGFYARLAGDVSGGFAGTRTIISPTVLASTTATVQNELVTDLERRLMNTVPEGYVMYPTIYAKSFVTPTVTSIDAKTARISVGATVYSAMFKKADFARFLAGASSTALFGSIGYTAPDIESISFTLANPKDFSPVKKTNLAARINGSFQLVGDIPVDGIKKAVAGISLSKTRDILKKYVSVIDLAKSAGEINPPWIGTVPTDLSHISIVIKKP